MASIKKAPSLSKWLMEEENNPNNEKIVSKAPKQEDVTVVKSVAAKGPSNTEKLIGALCLTVLTSSGGILMQLSKVQGVYKYNTATVPLLAELLKLAISSTFLTIEYNRRRTVNMTFELKTVIKYIVPSILYLCCNNLSLEVLRHLRPSTYQVLGNLRIVTTGLLTLGLMGRPLGRLQWIALVLMTLGATTTQLGEDHSSEAASDGEHGIGDRLTGYALSLLLCFLASLAGVYTERVMKGNNDSMHWQNIQLYGFGLLFNAARLTVDDVRHSFHHGFWGLSLLQGYSSATWLVVVNLALSGLLVSFITKYVDAIAKNFSTSLAMFLTPLVALPLFGHQPTFALFIGAIIAAISINLYYAKPEHLFPLLSTGAEPNLVFATAKTQDPASPNPLPSNQDKV